MRFCIALMRLFIIPTLKNVTSSIDYFATLLYDNVLTGDYQQLATVNDHPYAAGGPLAVAECHERAE